MARHGTAPFKGLAHFCDHSNDRSQRSGRFGRLFPTLPGLYTDPDILFELGDPTGPMNGGAGSSPCQSVEVGQVFFGQFIDHDITLDVSSSLSSVNNPIDIRNVHTPTLDLDCVYGSGPEASNFLFKDGIKLLTGADGSAAPSQSAAHRKQDLVRNSESTAVIGDFRNDENRIVSQIQLNLIRFHNKVVDQLSAKYSGHELYEESRKLVTRHYHWAVLNDFLVKMCGDAVVKRILHSGREFYLCL